MSGPAMAPATEGASVVEPPAAKDAPTQDAPKVDGKPTASNGGLQLLPAGN